MKLIPWKTLTVCLIAILAVALFVQPAMADGDEKKVRVKKTIKCENGDCTETVENLGDGGDVEILVSGDGAGKHVKIHKIKCDGEGCDEAEGHHNMVFVGDHGDIEVMAGGEGHTWISHGAGFGGGFLGVGLAELTPELREHFGVSAESGVMVSKIVDDSPAFKAGLEVGDIITGVDGKNVKSGSALARTIRGHQDGEEVLLSVWRDGSARSITAAVEERRGDVRFGNMDTLHERMGDLHEQMGDVHKRMRKIKIHCDDGDSECDTNIDIAGIEDFDCGSDDCKVNVQCDDDECTCTVNGEEADCAGIPGVRLSRD